MAGVPDGYGGSSWSWGDMGTKGTPGDFAGGSGLLAHRHSNSPVGEIVWHNVFNIGSTIIHRL